jgi:hypothetical protein
MPTLQAGWNDARSFALSEFDYYGFATRQGDMFDHVRKVSAAQFAGPPA